MRFKLKPEPSLGDKRIITKFAWFPIQIDKEIRWLEKVTIAQRYRIKNIILIIIGKTFIL